MNAIAAAQSHSAVTQSQFNMARLNVKYIRFEGGRQGLHIDTFLNRVETHFPPNLSDVDRVNMLIAQIVEGPHTGNICRNGWTGTYASLRLWLIQTYRDIIPEVSVSDWASVTRSRGVAFKDWQTVNIRIIDHTWANWDSFTDSERVMVMRGLERIVPKPALIQYQQGSTFNTITLRQTSFGEILKYLNEHSEAWSMDCWSRFESRLTVARQEDSRALNIQNNAGRGRQRRRFQQSQNGGAQTTPPVPPPKPSPSAE